MLGESCCGHYGSRPAKTAEERNREQALANKELIRNLAHEIKNPLGGIRGAAQLLEMGSKPRPPGIRRSSSRGRPAAKPG